MSSTRALFSRVSFLLIAAFAAGALVLAGCDSTTSEGDEFASGQVNVQITNGSSGGGAAAPRTASTDDATDAPAEIEEAFVTIAGVELVGEESRFTLSEEEQEVDLFALRDSVPVDLALGEVPPGEYEQLRLDVTDTRLLLSDGSEPDLKVPSGEIKLLLPDFEIEGENDEAEITVAFDIDDSFVRAGASGKYIFKPTVRAQSVEVNDEELGETVELTGEVTALDEGTTVSVEGLPFTITGATETGEDDEEGEDAPALEVGQFVELEAGRDESGAYVAREIEVRSDTQDVAVLEAPIDEVRSDALVLLGVPFTADADTEFDGFSALTDLDGSSRAEVEFAYDESADAYRLLKIEAESSEEDGDDDEEEDEE